MDDKTLIERLGGPANLARRLGYDLKRGGTQRVQNWIRRGIPAAVKLEHPDVFLRGDGSEFAERRQTDRRKRAA